MKTISVRLALTMALLTMSTAAAAQTSDVVDGADTTTTSPTEVRYHHTSTITFGNAAIEGSREKPGWTPIKSTKRPAFRNLIELRSSFRDALSTTPSQL